MANNFSRRILFFIFLIFFFLGNLYAQSKPDFSQKLEWKSNAEAYEYKVEIKNLTTGKLTEFTTEKTQIEFSLPSGDYEWCVIAYDFLGRESTKTEWETFTIKKAIEPTVEIKNKEVVTYIQEQFSIPVETSKIVDGATVELIDVETKEVISGEIKDDTVVFDTVPEGNYKIKITNPGGLYSETPTVKLTDKNRIDDEKRIAEEKLAEEERLKEEQLEEKKRKEEEERLAKEEKRLAEEAQKLEKERLAKEKQIEQEQKEEEKHVAKEIKREEKQKEKEEHLTETTQEYWQKMDVFIMFGMHFPIPVFGNNTFLNNRSCIGTNLKAEIFPNQEGFVKVGLNVEINPMFTNFSNSSLYENLTFFPVTFNLSFLVPIVNDKIFVVAQAGCGGLGVFRNGNYFQLENKYVNNKMYDTFFGCMIDIGVSFRFILEKNLVFDITGEFTNWGFGTYNIGNVMIGMQFGFRL